MGFDFHAERPWQKLGKPNADGIGLRVFNTLGKERAGLFETLRVSCAPDHFAGGGNP